MPTLVSGTITFPGGTESFSGATLHVVLEEVGMMDAPAQIIAQNTQRNFSYNGSPVRFSLDGNPPPADGTYNLRVLVSRNGGKEIEQGDYITKRRYRVLKNGAPDTANVEVERV
jgi:uncharacterized lipoprotein YbaY